MDYIVGSISFSGPLDLLLELVKTNKCDIKDIFIKDIINQYYEIVQTSSVRESELASDFLVLASSLLQIKSRYLIYLNNIDDDTIDPTIQLLELLEEYKKFKNLAEILKEKYYVTQMYYTKTPEEILEETSIDISQYTINDLHNCFLELQRQENNTPTSTMVSYKKISVQEKINDIESALKNLSKIYFESLINKDIRDDVVASFLGILELAKEQKVNLTQQDFFENIIIERGQYEG